MEQFVWQLRLYPLARKTYFGDRWRVKGISDFRIGSFLLSGEGLTNKGWIRWSQEQQGFLLLRNLVSSYPASSKELKHLTQLTEKETWLTPPWKGIGDGWLGTSRWAAHLPTFFLSWGHSLWGKNEMWICHYSGYHAWGKNASISLKKQLPLASNTSIFLFWGNN